MTSRIRLLRVVSAAAMAASLVLAGGSGRLALANGVGDLYVADPKGVLEVYLKASTIETPITIPSVPSMLAFTVDGQTLYTADASTDLYQIKISDLSVSGPTRTAKPIMAMAHPFGSSLFLAVKDTKTLSVLVDGASTFIDGPTLPSTPDLLAADPRETRFAAAAKGAGWVSIVEPASSQVTQVGGSTGIGGTVVAMAIARAEGYVWVATTGPNRVALVSLSTGKVVSSAPLDAAPTAITALGKYAVASTGSGLFKIQGTSASTWATAPGTVLALASDLTAQFVYVATAGKVTALSVANPTASPAASVSMPNGAPVALAPVPNKGSSLATGSGTAQSSVDPGAGGTTGTAAQPHKTHAPSTDTVLGPTTRTSAPDLLTLVLLIGSVVISVVGGSRYVIKRLVGEA